MKITAPSIKMPPEGWHRAVLSSYEDLGLTPDKYKPGKNRHVVKLVFKLDDDSEQFVWARASGKTPIVTTTKSRRGFSRTIFGAPFQMERLMGKRRK